MLAELQQLLTLELDPLKEDKASKGSRRRKRRRSPKPNCPTGDLKRKWTADYKSTGCAKCSESRLQVLDLHHLDPSTKKFGISRGIRLAVTEAQFRAELRKTVPLCRNCHAQWHYLDNHQKITFEEYLTNDY